MSTETSVQEPKPRKDGTCVVCRKKMTTVTRYSEPDAFCSAACARKFYGSEIPVKDMERPPGRRRR
jgi:hypothetical protein